MHYDIATKRLMELGGVDILRDIAGLDVAELEPIQQSGQETFDLKRCDYVGKCYTPSGEAICVVLEFQTRWEEGKSLDMVLYTLHHRRRHRLSVLPVMLLFLPDARAAGEYAQDGIQASYRLVKMWELSVEILLQPQKPWLWPFAALCAAGVEQAERIDSMIHEADLQRRAKSDLLTILTVFLGLKNMSVARTLVEKRRELMIESPMYNLIKDEGRVEGRVEGRMEERIASRREMLWTVLDERFHPEAEALKAQIMAITDVDQLVDLLKLALRVDSLAEFCQRLR